MPRTGGGQTVLWEDRCLWWIDDHQHLVTPEEHAEALQVLRPLRKCHPPLAPCVPEGYTWWNGMTLPSVLIIEQQAPLPIWERQQPSGSVRDDARCREVNPPDAAAFLDENHIQGGPFLCPDRPDLRAKNWWPDDLRRPSTAKQDAPVGELVRYAVKLGHNVPGGASRLFRKFVDTVAPPASSVIPDKEKPQATCTPSWVWLTSSPLATSGGTGKSSSRRYSAWPTNSKLITPLPGIATMSESQIMQKLGYTKILSREQ